MATLTYPATYDWNRYGWVTMSKSLNAGINTLRFTYNSGYSEIDCIEVYKPSTECKDHFRIINRNSLKLLEVYQASTANGATVCQYGNTGHSCQRWYFEATGNHFKIINLNSLKYLDITGNSTVDGAIAIQNVSSTNYSQQWSLSPTDNGYYRVVNRNSGKYLEIMYASTEDGATANQWGNTNHNCQHWAIVKEGIE